MTRIAERPATCTDCGPAVRKAIQRIQRAVRATQPEPEIFGHQPAAWLLSWPAIVVLWLAIGAIAYARFTGRIN